MKNRFYFFLFTVCFFLNSQYNVFNLIPRSQFEYSKLEESETLIIGKLLNSEKYGILSDGGFTGTYIIDPEHTSRFSAGSLAYQYYMNDEYPEKVAYNSYRTQIGGQAIIYSLISRILPFNNQTTLEIFRSINSLLLALVLSSFLVWIRNKWGLMTTVITFSFLIIQSWLFLFGKSTWWCNWIYFLPFVYGLHYFENNSHPNFKKYTLHLFGLFFLKFWINGFEFISTFLICSAIPYLYYNFKNTKQFYFKFLKYHFTSTALAVLLAITFQCLQFYLIYGDFKQGLEHLINAFNRRSSMDYNYPVGQDLLIYLKDLRLDIVFRYMGNSFTNSELLGFKIPFLFLFLLGLVATITLYKLKKDRRLILITWFSVISPLSWLIIFRQHAHIHTHIDFFIWYCPSILLIILLISLAIKNTLFKKFK